MKLKFPLEPSFTESIVSIPLRPSASSYRVESAALFMVPSTTNLGELSHAVNASADIPIAKRYFFMDFYAFLINMSCKDTILR